MDTVNDERIIEGKMTKIIFLNNMYDSFNFVFFLLKRQISPDSNWCYLTVAIGPGLSSIFYLALEVV